MIDAPPNRLADRRLDVLRCFRSRDDEFVLDATHADELPHGILGRLALKAKADRALERYPTAGDGGFDSTRYRRVPIEHCFHRIFNLIITPTQVGGRHDDEVIVHTGHAGDPSDRTLDCPALSERIHLALECNDALGSRYLHTIRSDNTRIVGHLRRYLIREIMLLHELSRPFLEAPHRRFLPSEI